MEGKLFKMVEGYTLSLTGSIDDLYGISNKELADDHGLHKLSVKNCEFITNGYDLEELACDKIGIDISVVKHIDRKVIEKNESTTTPIHEAGALGAGLYHMVKGFEIGFLKAMELIGDKKFSELDKKIDGMVDFAKNHFTTDAYDIIQMFVDNLKVNIQKIQQPKEWDVEICCYIGNGDEESDSFKDPFVTNTGIPKLDENKCLILKRK